MPKTPTIPETHAQWPDVEKAMVTLLDDMLAQLDPPGEAYVVPPADYDERLANGTAIVTVQRTGGQADRINDTAGVNLTVTTAQRNASWDVMGWLRPQLHNYNGVVRNSDGTVAIIEKITDMQGPRRTPDMNQDMRRVTAGLNVTTRLTR